MRKQLAQLNPGYPLPVTRTLVEVTVPDDKAAGAELKVPPASQYDAHPLIMPGLPLAWHT